MPNEPVGVAVIGMWHVHAADYAELAAQSPRAALVAGWDPDPAFGRTEAGAIGVEFVSDLDALLADPRIAAVTITTATRDHSEVITRALGAGKHVFSEKLLAPTVAEAVQLSGLAAERGLALVISLPRLSESAVVTAREVIRAGTLGDLTYARVRMAHNGWLEGWLPERFGDPAAALGGSFTDLGCHPAYLVQLFLGAHPATVSATYGSVTGRAVEDNSVVTLGYAQGAIGVAESGFVNNPGTYTFEIRGTKASLLYEFDGEQLLGKGGSFGQKWVPVPLAPAEPAPFELWLDAIAGAADPSANVAAAIELTRLVTAANHAAESGRSVPYPKE